MVNGSRMRRIRPTHIGSGENFCIVCHASYCTPVRWKRRTAVVWVCDTVCRLPGRTRSQNAKIRAANVRAIMPPLTTTAAASSLLPSKVPFHYFLFKSWFSNQVSMIEKRHVDDKFRTFSYQNMVENLVFDFFLLVDSLVWSNFGTHRSKLWPKVSTRLDSFFVVYSKALFLVLYLLNYWLSALLRHCMLRRPILIALE